MIHAYFFSAQLEIGGIMENGRLIQKVFFDAAGYCSGYVCDGLLVALKKGHNENQKC